MILYIIYSSLKYWACFGFDALCRIGKHAVDWKETTLIRTFKSRNDEIEFRMAA